MIRLLAFAICLALLATTSASAQTSKADPVFLPLVDRFVPMADIPPPPTPGPTRSAGPVSVAQVDRFLRVLPHEQKFNIDPQLDEGRLARLERLNPGHEQELRVILTAEAACLAAPSREAAIRTLRTSARNLGPEKLNRLIAYYTGPDSRALDRLWAAARKRHRMSKAEAEEVYRLMSSYPLQDWEESRDRSIFQLKDDRSYREAIARCSGERQAALRGAGLRSALEMITPKASGSESK